MYRNAQMYLNPRNKVTLTQFKLKAIFKTFTLERNVQTNDNFKHQDLNYSG